MKCDAMFRHSPRYLAMMYSHEKYGGVSEPVTIIPSPNPIVMKCFGGNLTEEQYRNEIGKFLYNSIGLTTEHSMTYLFTKEII
jgi:hypothetical protein